VRLLHGGSSCFILRSSAIGPILGRMQDTQIVDELILRRIALEEGVDYRTVRKALAGEWIRGDFCRARAARAARRVLAESEVGKQQ
jgi:hypothetical protein